MTTVYFFISRQCKLNLIAVQMEKSNTLAYAPKPWSWRSHKVGVLWFSFTPEEKASCAETSQEHFIHYQIMSLPSIRPLPETSRSCVHRTKRRSAMSRKKTRQSGERQKESASPPAKSVNESSAAGNQPELREANTAAHFLQRRSQWVVTLQSLCLQCWHHHFPAQIKV